MNSVAQRRLRILLLVERLCELRAVNEVTAAQLIPEGRYRMAGAGSAPRSSLRTSNRFERANFKVRFSCIRRWGFSRETSLVCHQRLLPRTNSLEQRTNLVSPSPSPRKITDPARRKSVSAKETLHIPWISIIFGVDFWVSKSFWQRPRPLFRWREM